MMRMPGFVDEVCINIFKLSSNYYSFVSGVGISIAINLWTQWACNDLKMNWMLVGIILILCSSLLWFILSVKLQNLQCRIKEVQIANTDKHNAMQENEAWRAIITEETAHRFLLGLLLVVAIILLAVGCACFMFQNILGCPQVALNNTS